MHSSAVSRAGRLRCSSFPDETHEVRFGKARRMHLLPNAKKPAEAHNQWPPFLRVNMRTRSRLLEQRLIHVQPCNVNFESIRRDILSKWPPIVHHSFHLHGAFPDARRFYVERRRWSEPSGPELVRFVAVTPTLFLFRHRILPGGERQPVDVPDLILRRQVDDALACADQILGSFAHGSESQHATPAQPPRRRHGSDVRSAVFIQGGDQRDRSAEIQNRRINCFVHETNMAQPWRRGISVSCRRILFVSKDRGMLLSFPRSEHEGAGAKVTS